VISVDTKKKELVGDFKNPGQVWCQTPERVKVHDFPSEAVGRAVPYGIYDLQHNHGTVYVGQSADTPAFAVDNIAHWCRTEMPNRFPNATHLMVEADCGGSNGYRSRVWKRDLQEKVADALGLTVTVCHYPTGTSKWNPIEHRVFSEISKTWAGCPLRSFDDILHYIRDTKTETGLTVQAHLVTKTYEKGVKVPDDEMDALCIQSHDVCPQWSYTIYPRRIRPQFDGCRKLFFYEPLVVRFVGGHRCLKKLKLSSKTWLCWNAFSADVAPAVVPCRSRRCSMFDG
jgi:hypothetical protein